MNLLVQWNPTVTEAKEYVVHTQLLHCYEVFYNLILGSGEELPR
jgi:hypothetical protein